MQYKITEEGGFKYIETKGGDTTLVLLHGLFGALSNFSGILNHFGSKYNVVVPILPIYDLPLRKLSVTGLVDNLAKFIRYKGYDKVHLLGNSLGGHIALLYAIAYPEKVAHSCPPTLFHALLTPRHRHVDGRYTSRRSV